MIVDRPKYVLMTLAYTLEYSAYIQTANTNRTFQLCK